MIYKMDIQLPKTIIKDLTKCLVKPIKSRQFKRKSIKMAIKNDHHAIGFIYLRLSLSAAGYYSAQNLDGLEDCSAFKKNIFNVYCRLVVF